jgi:SAM-dependent methyltransferase
MREARFLEALGRLGVADWRPPGRFDPDAGVWVTEIEASVSFPESGVDVFSSVDLDSFWFDHRNEVIADLLSAEVPPDLTFVEIGSGSGVVVDYLRRTSTRPIASVEPIPAGANAVAKRGVLLSFCGDLASLDLPTNSIPALGAFDVLEHLDKPELLLEECRRVMKSDGRLILTVPAYPWLWSEHDVWNGHVQRFTLSTFTRLLNESGFEVVKGTYLFLPLLFPAMVSRLVFERIRRRRSDGQIESHMEGALAPKSPTIHRILRLIHAVERVLVRRAKVPFGTSILVAARPKPTDSDRDASSSDNRQAPLL